MTVTTAIPKPKEAYARRFYYSLCPGGERRGQEAASQRAEECASIHDGLFSGHIGQRGESTTPPGVRLGVRVESQVERLTVRVEGHGRMFSQLRGDGRSYFVGFSVLAMSPSLSPSHHHASTSLVPPIA